MQNVLFIVPSLRRAGAETQVIDLVNSLREPAFNIHLLCFEADLSQRDRVSAAVKFHHIPRRGKYDLTFIRGIARLIDREEITVIHGTLEFSMLVGWLARRLARRSPPLIVAIHTTLPRGVKEQAHDRLIYQWIFRQCGAIVFVCQRQAEYWVHRYPFMSEKLKVIHNGIDLEKFKADFSPGAEPDYRLEYAVPPDACIISCIAGFRPEKGHELLITAFGRLGGDVHLFLAGDGERRAAIELLVESSGLADRVHFLGNVADVRPLLKATDVSVLASTAVETFSIAMLESFAMGVPMVAPDIGGLSEAIFQGRTGWIFPAGDADGLTGLLEQAVHDRERLKAMGGHARALVEQKFSKEVMADAMTGLLHDVASGDS